MKLPINYNKATREERWQARQQYEKDQNGNCYHCGFPLWGPPSPEITSKQINWKLFPGGREGFLKYPTHLHHSHVNGMTIGAVHAYCNAFLWQYLGE